MKRQYFRYKLSGQRGLFAASTVLALAGFPAVITFLMIVKIILGMKEVAAGAGFTMQILIGIYGYTVFPLSWLGLFAIALITPIVSFKYYTNRACTDTIGSLPLTYKDRFLGDFLSGFASVCSPFVLTIPYVAIMSNVVEKIGDVNDFSGVSEYFTNGVIILALITVSAYTFSSLAVSLCGKAGSAVFSALFGSAVLPGIVFLYSAFIGAGVVGINPVKFSLNMADVIPPAGLIPSFYIFWSSYTGQMYTQPEDVIYYFNPSPVIYVILILLTFSYAVGAYYLGKHRKTENVGKLFVYKKAHEIVNAVITIAIMGFAFLIYVCQVDVDGMEKYAVVNVIAAVIAFIAYLITDFIFTKRIKNAVKNILKYAVICGACFGVFYIARATDSFGIGDTIPNVGDVSRIEINGDYLYNQSNSALEYDDLKAIETIISEHKKLLSNPDGITTGDGIIVSYKLKNGFEINRGYDFSSDEEENENDPLRKMAKIISELPSKNDNVYGILENGNYKNLTFKTTMYTNTTEDVVTIDEIEEFVIRPDKTEEFKDILYNDIKNHYKRYGHSAALVYAYYDLNGEAKQDMFHILDTYTDTIAFLNNPENRLTESESGITDTYGKTFNFTINGGMSLANVGVDASANSETAQEILSMCYMSVADPSEIIEVYDNSNLMRYYVSRKDEKRAAELILKLAKETVANTN